MTPTQIACVTVLVISLNAAALTTLTIVLSLQGRAVEYELDLRKLRFKWKVTEQRRQGNRTK